MSGMPVLEVRNLESGYLRQLLVLKGVSLKVFEGQVVTVLGSNGAGKSTLLKTIMALIDDEPRKGEVLIDGRNVTRRPTEAIARAGIAYVVEGRGMFPELTVAENLQLGAYHRRDRQGIRADLDRGCDVCPRPAERRNQPSRTMSGGEQQTLAIARPSM